MTLVSLLIEDDFEQVKFPTQINFLGDSSINVALTTVAQEVARLIQQTYPALADSSSTAEAIADSRSETIVIRAIEPEYKQVMTIEPLTIRELKVLQLIVDGHSNSIIAEKLYISTGTVKTHVRNILKKLCVNDRTQAAIRVLRSGLVH